MSRCAARFAPALLVGALLVAVWMHGPEVRALTVDQSGSVAAMLVVDTSPGSPPPWFRCLFLPGVADTIVLYDGTSLILDSGSLASGDTAWLRVVIHGVLPSNATPPDPPLVVPGAGVYRRFERESGDGHFAGTVVIGIPYDDRNLPIPERSLAIYRYDPVARKWVKELDTWIDEDSNIAWARVGHFTEFAVFGVSPSSNLGGVVVYPNPFVPFDGDASNGRPYSPGDLTSGILFGNLTDEVDIDIFTIAGERVATIHAAHTGGTLQWDARNDAGRELASGVYLAVIRGPRGEHVIRKIMIIR